MGRHCSADIAIFDGNHMEIFTLTIYTIIDGENSVP